MYVHTITINDGQKVHVNIILHYKSILYTSTLYVQCMHEYIYVPSASVIVILRVDIPKMTLSGPARLRNSVSSPSRPRLSAMAMKSTHGWDCVGVIITCCVRRVKSRHGKENVSHSLYVACQ